MLDRKYNLVRLDPDECNTELDYISSLYQKDEAQVSEFIDNTLETSVFIVTKQAVN